MRFWTRADSEVLKNMNKTSKEKKECPVKKARVIIQIFEKCKWKEKKKLREKHTREATQLF